MSLVPSLLQAIVHLDGEALVMHAGDKPYVVSPSGQVDLATRGLALDAINGIVNHLLPVELQTALDEFGAVQYELPARAEFPGEQFTVVAARGGDDVWVEVRRRSAPDEDRIPDEFFPAPEEVAKAQSTESLAFEPESIEPAIEPEVEPPPTPVVAAPPPIVELRPTPLRQLVPPPDPDPFYTPVIAAPPAMITPPAPVESPRVPEAKPAPQAVEPPAMSALPPIFVETPPREDSWLEFVTSVIEEPEVVVAEAADPEPEPYIFEPEPPPAQEPAFEPEPKHVEEPAAVPPAVAPVVLKEAPQPAVVLPLARNPVRFEHQLPLIADPTLAGLDRLLRLAAARGASTLYLSSQSCASVRVDGELQALEGEPILTSRDVESLLLTLMPERNHEALRTGAATEWILDIEDVGRVRCMSFRDHLGPGGVFRLMPTRSVSAEQLSLPRAVQALAIEPEGLLLIAGPRSSGKRTVMSAVVDLINRTRRDHVITIEREINIVHERGSSFISQREVRGNDDDMLAAAQAALREDPDVLMIEELRTAGLMSVALDAAQSGHLVIGSFSAHTATAAVDRIIDLYAPEQRRQVQLALADSLRGVVSQVLLKRNGGGRVAAREVLLNTPAVSSVIAEGKTSQLPMVIEGGRRYGMIPLNDALVGLVQQGIVDGREAYRYSSDRPGLLAFLERQGVDTSFVEKLA